MNLIISEEAMRNGKARVYSSTYQEDSPCSPVSPHLPKPCDHHESLSSTVSIIIIDSWANGKLAKLIRQKFDKSMKIK